MNSLEEQLAAASDSTTAPDVLKRLSNSKHHQVRRAVAANPNTPQDLFSNLWREHPEALLENPIFDLWDFMGLERWKRVNPDMETLLGLYNSLRRSSRPLPERFLGAGKLRDLVVHTYSLNTPAVFECLPFEEDADLRLSLVENAHQRSLFPLFEKHAPDAVWERLAADPDPRIRYELSAVLGGARYEEDPTRPVILKVAGMLADDPRVEVHKELAKCAWLPAPLVERLSRSPSADVRAALIFCKDAPHAVLLGFVSDPDVQVRAKLAANTTDTAIQELLLRSDDPAVRARLASNRHLTTGFLHRFDMRDHPDVLCALFKNGKADAALRLKILADRRKEVQRVLLDSSEKLTLPFFQKIKGLLSVKVLEGIPRRTNIDPAVTEELSRHPDAAVRLAVATRLRTSCTSASDVNVVMANRLARDPDAAVRLEICRDSRLDKEINLAHFRDLDASVRLKSVRYLLGILVSCANCKSYPTYAAVHRRNAPLLVELASDPDKDVRLAIADCREAPPEALGILFDDADEDVRDSARGHVRWPFGVVLDFEAGYRRKSKGMRFGETTPSTTVLGKLARSRNPFVRHMVARCSRSPAAAIRALVKDAHPVVAEAARVQLEKRRPKKSD